MEFIVKHHVYGVVLVNTTITQGIIMPIVIANPVPDTAWDVTAASYVQAFVVSSEQNNVYDVSFKADGTKMFVMGGSPFRINQYSLSTAWDISTSSAIPGTHTTVANQRGMHFKEDGTVMYIADAGSDIIRAYTLSTAWDVSTSSQTSFLVITLQDTGIQDVSLKSDGTKMYVLGGSENKVFQYSLPTPWVLTGGTYDNVSKAFTSGESTSGGLFFRNDGSSFYLLANSILPTHAVRQYDTDTDWIISPSSVVGNFDTTSQTTLGRGLFFSDNGKRMYIGSAIGNDEILQYSL